MSTVERYSLHRLIQAGLDISRDEDGNWEVRYPRDGSHYLAPKSTGPTLEEAIAAYMSGQRLCSTVGCDLPFRHTNVVSATHAQHHAVGPNTRADWAQRRAALTESMISGNIPPMLQVTSDGTYCDNNGRRVEMQPI